VKPEPEKVIVVPMKADVVLNVTVGPLMVNPIEMDGDPVVSVKLIV